MPKTDRHCQPETALSAAKRNWGTKLIDESGFYLAFSPCPFCPSCHFGPFIVLSYSRVTRSEMPLQTLDLDTVVVAAVLSQMEGEIRQREAQVAVSGPLSKVLGHML